MVNESELPNQAVSFCLVITETGRLTLSWWKTTCFLLTNSGYFSLSAAYSWSNWEQYLLELIVWFSGRVIRIISHNYLPVPPYIQHHLLQTKAGLWYVCWWFISLVPWSLPFHIIVQYPLFITHHNLFLKRNVFIMFKYKIMWGIMIKIFFRLTFVDPKQQSD